LPTFDGKLNLPTELLGTKALKSQEKSLLARQATNHGVYDAHLAAILDAKWAKSKNRHISATV